MSEYVRPEYTPLFRETQGIIADYLNSDPQISSKGIEFFPEAKLDIDFEVKKALGQQGIVGVVNTLKGTFAGHDGCTNAWQIEAEVDVIENPPVRRPQLKKMGLSTGTVSDILDWVQESLGGPSSPTFAKFNPVSQEIGQNNGLVVGRSIMRTLVLADTSAVISTENQWVCPYALRAELSALYDEIGELSSELSAIPTTTGANLVQVQHVSNWVGQRKVSDQLVFSDGKTGIIVSPDGSYWAIDTLYLTIDGTTTSIPLTLEKQYNLDGDGNISLIGFSASYPTTPYIVQVGNKTLQLWFKVDGNGVWGVQILDAQGNIVAEQPDNQAFSLCDLEFDYNGSRITLKADTNWKIHLPASEYIRDSMAFNPGEDFYNLMSNTYLPLSGGTMRGDLDMGGQHGEPGVKPMDSAFLKFMEFNLGYGELGSGFGIYRVHNDSLAVAYMFNDEDYPGEYDVVRGRDLSAYLPLSGGTITGNLSVGNEVVLEQDLGGGILKVSDGHGNWTWYQGSWINHNGSNFLYPTPQQTGDYTLATQEYVISALGDIESILEAM